MAVPGWWKLAKRRRSAVVRSRRRWRPRPVGHFESLESRRLLTVTLLDGAPYVYLGPSDNMALDQPRVAVELITGEQVNVTPASLVFTPTGPTAWNIPQMLTVSAIDDHLLEGPHSFTVKHTAASPDSRFSGETSNLIVGVGDNEGGNPAAGASGVSGSSSWFQINQTGGSTQVAEGPSGATDTYWVVLTAAPTDPVVITLFDDSDPALGVVGPSMFSTLLLDTGANSVLVFASAVAELEDPPYEYAIEGEFLEEGIAGDDVYDISEPYRFDFAGGSYERNTVRDARILSDSENDISMFGPWGIVGMPAMAGRVTSLDMTGWTGDEFAYMETDFGIAVPPDDGNRLSVPVDNRLTWDPEAQVTSGEYPPVWADIPFLSGTIMQDGAAFEGIFLFDTGAQLSVMPVDMAMGVGLDSNGDGLLDENDDNFARYETVGGIGGQITAPVFLFDEFHVGTEQGPDLVWTDLQWLVLDVAGGQFGVFGSDLLTSGWIEPYFGLSDEPGYFEQVHFDFRDFALYPFGGGQGEQSGLIHFDLNPNVGQITYPTVPGAMIVESDRYTMVTESGMNDIYQVVLTEQPAADVTITLTNPAGELTAVDDANPANDFVVFTSSNWEMPQTVRVTAVDDGQFELFHRSSVFHTSTSTDPGYQDVDIRRVFTNIVDRDTAGVMLLPNDDSTDVTEGGNTDTYQVVLTNQPTGNVTIELLNGYGQVTAVDALNPGNDFLQFTPSNWGTPQTVLVRAVDDALTEGPHHTRIMHRLVTGDDDYQMTYIFPKPVNITDNDTGGAVGGVVGRYIFYDNSHWDGDTAGPNTSGGPFGSGDDGAIATDKQALLPGQTATFANYTGYHRGINGIVVDIQGLVDPSAVEDNDFSEFVFKVGNDDTPGDWPPAPDPVDVDVRYLGGGVHRVTITWADNAIANKNWLQVTVKAHAATGLEADDVFYFGNSSGENTGDFRVDYSDAFDNIWPSLFTPDEIGVEHAGDVNRDGRIDYSDVFDAVWPNLFGPSPLVQITPPAAPASPPQSTGFVFGENRPWAIELMWFDELYGTSSNSEEEEDDTLEATAVDNVFAVYDEE